MQRINFVSINLFLNYKLNNENDYPSPLSAGKHHRNKPSFEYFYSDNFHHRNGGHKMYLFFSFSAKR